MEDQSTPRAGVLVTGSEIVAGDTRDENGARVAAWLQAHGFDTKAIVAVGDLRASIRMALVQLASQCDLVVVTGGLGPTRDDVTAEAIAHAVGLSLRAGPLTTARVLRRALRERIPRDTRRRVAFVRGVLKMARVPRGARIIAPAGTAPGWVLPGDELRAMLIVLPGPKREVGVMLARAAEVPDVAAVLGRLPARFARTYRLVDDEDSLQAFLDALARGPLRPARLRYGICWQGSGHLELSVTVDEADRPYLGVLGAALEDRYGAALYSTDSTPPSAVVAQRLKGRPAVVTGGSAAALLVAHLARSGAAASYLANGHGAMGSVVTDGGVSVRIAAAEGRRGTAVTVVVTDHRTGSEQTITDELALGLGAADDEIVALALWVLVKTLRPHTASA